MADWKYNPENYNPNGFTLIPEGNYRVRIDTAENKVSRSGKDMIKLTLSVSGNDTTARYGSTWCSTAAVSKCGK